MRTILRTTPAVAIGILLSACGGGGGSGGGASAPAVENPQFGSCAQLSPSTSPAGSLGAAVDSLAAEEIRTKRLPGLAVAIAKAGTVLYARGYGYANVGACTPVEVGTEFQIGSITKQFTSAAILKLHSDGLLDIDATVSNYLPSYAFDSRITVRMLLNQTSGLADYTEFPQAPSWVPGVTQQVVLTAITQAPLRFEPGAAFDYSNSNGYILGTIIEAVSGVTYENYLATHILQPHSLTHTTMQQPLTAAAPYSYVNPATPGATGLAAGIVPHPSGFFASGALWSNLQDVVAWNNALLTGTIIPAASLQLMFMPPTVTEFQQTTASSYGMGWVVESEAGHPFAWHNGQTLAYTAFNGVFLDDGFAVVALTNVDAQESAPFRAFAQRLIQSICGTPSTASNC